jgi:hypothetical protein
MRHVDLNIPELKTKYVTYTNPDFVVTRYMADMTLAFAAMDEGRPVMLSVNLGDYGLTPDENEIFVKDYSQDERLPEILEAAGIAKIVVL